MNSFTLGESPGMLPAIPGYNPILDLDYLPEGYTAEYYGDDALYVGYNGELIAMIVDRPEIGITRIRPEFLNGTSLDVLLELKERIEAIDAESYPVETYAGKYSGNRNSDSTGN
jgi:hypothetical protein